MGNYLFNKHRTQSEWIAYASTQKAQDAIPIYEKIYPEFEKENNIDGAIDILIILSKLYTEEIIVADLYLTIAKMYKKNNNINRYVYYLENSTDAYYKLNMFSKCGYSSFLIAQETGSLSACQQTVDYYEMADENNTSTYFHMAKSLFLIDPKTSAKLFEKIAKISIKSDNLFSVPSDVFHAIFCNLFIEDFECAKKLYEKYKLFFTSRLWNILLTEIMILPSNYKNIIHIHRQVVGVWIMKYI